MNQTPEPTNDRGATSRKRAGKAVSAEPSKTKSSTAARTGARQAPPTVAPRPARKKAPARVRKPASATALKSISEVRHFFRTSNVPVHFVGATPFNLMGLDRWVRGLSYITYYDGWDGANPRVFTPTSKPYVEFHNGEEINNWLLTNLEVQAHIAGTATPGVRPKIAMVSFNEETERICAELGYDLMHPSVLLRSQVASAFASSTLAAEMPASVVTTVQSRDELPGQPDITVTKGVDYRSVAVEAVLVSQGTVIGPAMSGVNGRPELTPYQDDWCGDELHGDVLSDRLQVKASQLVRRVGDWLASQGWRGIFEVDLLVDAEQDEVHLGKVNLGISGATALTDVSAAAYADLPLFLFHLLEFMAVDLDLDLDEVNRRSSELAADEWSMLVIKETSPRLERIATAAPTGLYSLDANGALTFRHAAPDWHQLRDESEVFFLRIYGPGDFRWSGADLGVLVTRGRVRTGSGEQPDALTPRAQHLVESIRASYSGVPLALVS